MPSYNNGILLQKLEGFLSPSFLIERSNDTSYGNRIKWEKSRGIGQIGDYTILHKDTFVDSKGRIKYSFDKIRVGTIKRNILQGTLEKIGKFQTETKELNLNADRGRLWIGRLTDVRKKETNYSSPFMLPVFDYSKI